VSTFTVAGIRTTTSDLLFLFQWRSSTFLQLMFSGGLIANIFLNSMGEVERITFDKVSLP